jgi:mutator protein MutT
VTDRSSPRNGPQGIGDPIVVVAAIIERHGRLLVARRLEGTHLGGLWEFPGGKCAPDEPHQMCLARELLEELGVESIVGDELIVTDHAYRDRLVRLHFRRCEIVGEPRAMLDQELRWVTPAELQTLELPEGDREVVAILTREN